MTDSSSPSNSDQPAGGDTPPPSVPAGWYPTPDGKQRYWDGSAWTDLPWVEPAGVTATTPGGTSNTRRLILILGGAVVLLILIIIAVVVATSVVHKAVTPTTFTLRGTMAITDDTGFSGGTSCAGTEGYDDITSGAQVIIHNQVDKTIATGELEGGEVDGDSCVFKFAVPDVPLGQTFYRVEVSHRGFVEFTAKQARAGDVGVSLGN
jgi:hypothetical protein